MMRMVVTTPNVFKAGRFVHYSAILGDGYRTLTEGDLVKFEVVQDTKGLQAANVEKKIE